MFFFILAEGGAAAVLISFLRILCRNNRRLYFILMWLRNFELKEETGNVLNCVEYGRRKSS